MVGHGEQLAVDAREVGFLQEHRAPIEQGGLVTRVHRLAVRLGEYRLEVGDAQFLAEPGALMAEVGDLVLRPSLLLLEADLLTPVVHLDEDGGLAGTVFRWLGEVVGVVEPVLRTRLNEAYAIVTGTPRGVVARRHAPGDRSPAPLGASCQPDSRE